MAEAGSNVPNAPKRPAESAPVTEKEQKILDMLQEKLGDRMKAVSFNTIIRFVRGFANEEKREEKTLEMLDSCLKWREENKVDQIAQTDYGQRHQEFKEMWPTGFHGIGKNGHVVWVERPGKVDADKIWKKYTFEEVRDYHIKSMEQLVEIKEAITEQSGEMCYKHIVILDLEGIGLSHMRDKFYGPMKQIIHIDQYYYPETLHIMVITNASWIFKTLWAVASPWIDEVTKTRIVWSKSELEKYIDKDQLPKFLGGTCKCKDGKCLATTFIDGKGNEMPKRAPKPAVVGAEMKAEGPAPVEPPLAADAPVEAVNVNAPVDVADANAPVDVASEPVVEIVEPAAAEPPAAAVVAPAVVEEAVAPELMR